MTPQDIPSGALGPQVNVIIDGEMKTLNVQGPNAITIKDQTYIVDNISVKESDTEPGNNIITFTYISPPPYSQPVTLHVSYPVDAGAPNIFSPDPTANATAPIANNPWFTVNFMAVFASIMNNIASLQTQNQYMDMQSEIRSRNMSVEISIDLGKLAKEEKNAEAAQQITTAISEAIQAGVGLVQLKSMLNSAAKAQGDVDNMVKEANTTKETAFDKLAMKDPDVKNDLDKMLGKFVEPVDGGEVALDAASERVVNLLDGSPESEAIGQERYGDNWEAMKGKLQAIAEKGPLNIGDLTPEEVVTLTEGLTTFPSADSKFLQARQGIINDPRNIDAGPIRQNFEYSTSPAQKSKMYNEKYQEYNIASQVVFQTINHTINAAAAGTQSHWLQVQGNIQNLQQTMQGFKSSIDNFMQMCSQQSQMDQSILDKVLQDFSQTSQANIHSFSQS